MKQRRRWRTKEKKRTCKRLKVAFFSSAGWVIAGGGRPRIRMETNGDAGDNTSWKSNVMKNKMCGEMRSR